MWMGLIAGWILGSTMLYAYLIATAKEPRRPECMDCRLSDCADCPYLVEWREDLDVRRAA
jgi:hypothetical protein